MTEILNEARAKLERAEGYIKEVERDIGRWGDTIKPDVQRATLTGGHNPQEGYFSCIFADGPLPQPPAALSLLIGDALHNLRCALDYLAWQLVATGEGAKPLDEGIASRVQFPVVSTGRKGKTASAVFQDQHERRLPGVRTADIDEVRKWQPFVTNAANPEAEPLARFSRLSNHDKHRSLRPTKVLLTNLVADPIEANAHFVITGVEALTDTYTPGTEFLRVHGRRAGDGEPEVRVGFPNTTLTVVYEDIEVGVTSVLHDARQAIGTILDTFEPLLAVP